MKIFVTFASSSWRKAGARIVRQAKGLGAYDEVYGFDESNLGEAFRKRYRDKLVAGTRGFGYWCWKPQIILQAMETLVEGDILQYTDAGCHLNPAGLWRLKEYFERTVQSRTGILAFQAIAPTHPLPSLPCKPLDLMEYRWVKGDLLDHLGVRDDPMIVRTPTIGAGIIFIRKCDTANQLIKKWAAVVDDGFHFIDDTRSRAPNLPGFVEHRHDQAIFSILCKIHGVETLSAYEYWYPKKDGVTPDWVALKNYPIHAKRDKGFGPRKVASKLKQIALALIGQKRYPE